MCSISGFISSKPLPKWKANRLAAALLYYGTARGSQSSGVYNHTNRKLFKRAVDAEKFIDLAEFHAVFDGPTSLVLCHNRQPTCGGTGDDQAQPFIQGDTVSIHNGWYPQMKKLAETWGLVKPSGVDSELATAFIDTYGIEMLPLFLEDAQGSSAIATIWQDNLYVVRNGGPMYYLRFNDTEDREITIFASTDDILMHAARHVWLLLPRKWKAEMVTFDQIYKMTPGAMEKIGEPIQAKHYYRGEYEGLKHTVHTVFNGHVIGAPSLGNRPDDIAKDLERDKKKEDEKPPKLNLGKKDRHKGRKHNGVKHHPDCKCYQCRFDEDVDIQFFGNGGGDDGP